MSDYFDDDENKELLQGFIEEGRDMLDEVEPKIIELEEISSVIGAADPEVVNTIFRLFHSLKGGAGFLDLKNIQDVTHEAETLLDLFRKGEAVLSGEHVDLMTRTTDFIRMLLDNIEKELTDKGFEDDASHLVGDLKTSINEIKQAKTQDVEEEEEEEEVEEIEYDDEEESEEEMIEEDSDSEEYVAQTEESDSSEEFGDASLDALQLTITPEMVKQFVSESTELLEEAESVLLELEKNPSDEELTYRAFRALHSFKGNSGFLGYADLEKLSHHTESILERIRGKEIVADSKIFSLILDILDFLKQGVSGLSEGHEPLIPSIIGLINLLDESAAPVKTAQKSPEKKSKDKPKTKSKDKEKNKIESVEKPEPEEALTEDIKSTETAAAIESVKQTAAAAQRQSVRVDVLKLDQLLNLVGELVIAEAMVSQNPDLDNLNVNMDRFEKSVMHLEKITRDLQDLSTSIRMIPLEGTFRRMMRLVRDLSQKASKKVEFKIVGEETEVDKTVIEQITDPLIHIIRNAIDHGIEKPEIRSQSGKSSVGHLSLEAKYVGGEVWILVKDDGAGLSREKILKKAIEKNLIDGDGSSLSDDEVWKMIFLPGFSTAEKITDVSGRGVGMDVVSRNIEKIRGKVDVKSKTGKGAEVILRIPLTLAIIDGMLIRVGNIRYTIPIVDIKESFQTHEEDITRTMDGQEIVNIRGHLVPVVRLIDLFKLNFPRKKLTEGIIVLVENHGKSICLMVDELLGQQQIVIKGLSDYVGHIKCVSGCTILGDGDISLILDVASIISESENSTEISG